MRIILNIFFSLLFLLGCANTFAQEIPAKPEPARLVNDFTSPATLTNEQRDALEQKLVNLDKTTSTSVAVVLINKLNGASVSEYNQELGRKWGVGSAKNNGVVLLIARDDRKLDIAVGYGLEGALTDAEAQQIIDDVIRPNFRGDDYYRGIDEGTNAIILAVKGEYNTPHATTSTGKSGGGRIGFFIIVIVIILLLSGRKGGGGGNYMSRRGGSTLANTLFWTSMLSGGGRGGGGGWSGGGGGSGGGGFGGFGGGSFGGGGASGSW